VVMVRGSDGGDGVQGCDGRIIRMIRGGMVVDGCIFDRRIPCCRIRRPWRYRLRWLFWFE